FTRGAAVNPKLASNDDSRRSGTRALASRTTLLMTQVARELIAGSRIDRYAVTSYHTKVRVRPKVFWCALGSLACLASWCTQALAFCRTTTCDGAGQNTGGCLVDAAGCSAEGLPLFWPERCVALAVQQFGSPLLGITAAQTQEVLDAAIASWHGVDCGGAAPVFQFVQVEAVSCAEVEYNPGGPNVNV